METPVLDLAPITRHLRAMASSWMLVVAVHHIKVFEALRESALSLPELQQKLGLKDRPMRVLVPALLAMEMLVVDQEEKLALTELGRFLTTTCPANLIGYAGLEKEDAGVLALAQHLRNDGPENLAAGVSYVKDEAGPSPMDDPGGARFFTLALAGRARYLAPIVAAHLPRSQGHLLDVAGGTGYYTYEWLLANPAATATVLDRPEVLKVAQEALDEFCRSDRPGAAGVKQRVRFLPGDMLVDELPRTDVLLAASLFHDWPTETCALLAQKFADAIHPGGQLWIHDAFLNDALDGPLAVTDYSVMLFLGTKGRAYSRREYRHWLTRAGLQPSPESIPTLMDYGLIWAQKPG
jgi:O-methyltransferase domain